MIDWTAGGLFGPSQQPTLNPYDERDGCLRIVRTESGIGTLGDSDIYIASDGSRWKRADCFSAMICTTSAPVRRIRNGWLCNH